MSNRWLAAWVVLCIGLVKGQAPAQVAFQNVPNGVDVTIDGKPFAEYRFGDDQTPRPFFQHLHAPHGQQVTRNRPPVEGKDATDHATFHPGLWMSFGDLSGNDYWRTKERVEHVEFVIPPQAEDSHGWFSVRNAYRSGSRIVCHEVTRIDIYQRPLGTLIAWDATFEPAEGELEFGDQEEMGLGVRMATPLTVTEGGTIENSQGLRNESQVWGKTAIWCAYGGQIGKDRVGVLLMNDPDNFRPAWFHARDYGVIVANAFGRQAFTKGPVSQVEVPPGQTLRLHYGVYIYSAPSVDWPQMFFDYMTLRVPSK
jgi:hypothetical protein